MTREEILKWLGREYAPIPLATPNLTIFQLIENSIRYWNTHSAQSILRMYEVGSSVRIHLESDIKDVAAVYPASSYNFIFASHPLWSLLGMTILDNVTSDLIIMGESYRNYRYYIGQDFKYEFVPPVDTASGGDLYLANLPIQTTRVAVLGIKRIVSNLTAAVLTGDRASFTKAAGDTLKVTVNGVAYDSIDMAVDTVMEVATNINAAVGSIVATLSTEGFLVLISPTKGTISSFAITDGTGSNTGSTVKLFYAAIKSAVGGGDSDIGNEYSLEWILKYCSALLKQTEGRILRKGSIIGVTQDGDAMYKEGLDEQKILEASLAVDGRWVALARRA